MCMVKRFTERFGGVNFTLSPHYQLCRSSRSRSNSHIQHFASLLYVKCAELLLCCMLLCDRRHSWTSRWWTLLCFFCLLLCMVSPPSAESSSIYLLTKILRVRNLRWQRNGSWLLLAEITWTPFPHFNRSHSNWGVHMKHFHSVWAFKWIKTGISGSYLPTDLLRPACSLEKTLAAHKRNNKKLRV